MEIKGIGNGSKNCRQRTKKSIRKKPSDLCSAGSILTRGSLPQSRVGLVQKKILVSEKTTTNTGHHSNLLRRDFSRARVVRRFSLYTSQYISPVLNLPFFSGSYLPFFVSKATLFCVKDHGFLSQKPRLLVSKATVFLSQKPRLLKWGL